MKPSILAATLAAALLGGCFRTVVHAGTGTGTVRHTRTGWNLGWGLLDAEVITNCPSGMSLNQVWTPWWGIIPQIVTLGFVSPQRVTYACTPTVAPPPKAPPLTAPVVTTSAP